VNERILLHLRDSGYQGGTLAPAEASQQGIAKTLGLRLSHTSRALKALIGDGLVSEVLGRVPGEARRRKVYSLTPSGSALSQSIAGQVSERVVVVNSERGSTEMTLLEAQRLPGGPHSLARLLTLIKADGSLDLDDLDLGPERTGPVMFWQGRPPAWLFVGRIVELADAARWISSGTSILAVTGEAGVGKTALASEALRNWENPPHSFWYTFREYDVRQDLLAALAGFLGALGKGELAGRGGLSDRDVETLVARDLHDENVLLILDGSDRAPALDHLVQAIARGVLTAGGRILITARTDPMWLRDMLPERHMNLALGPMRVEDAVRILPNSLEPREARKLAELTSGNPRLLRTAAAIRDENLDSHEPEDRALLRFLRVRDA
jgi:DNA-binding MarR family transcriptional regulator